MDAHTTYIHTYMDTTLAPVLLGSFFFFLAAFTRRAGVCRYSSLSPRDAPGSDPVKPVEPLLPMVDAVQR